MPGKVEVYVNVYNGYHLGLHVHNREYSYGGGDPGVFDDPPHEHGSDFWYEVLTGFTKCTHAQVQAIVAEMNRRRDETWHTSYRQLQNGCPSK